MRVGWTALSEGHPAESEAADHGVAASGCGRRPRDAADLAPPG